MIQKTKKIKRENSKQTIFFSLVLLLLFLLVIGFLIISNLRINQRRSELNSQIRRLQEEIQVLEKKNQELKAGISQTEKESYWEEKIREQGYKKPGEEAVVVLPPPENENETKKEEKGIWQKLLEKIGF